ncbi:MAG TPA: cytochrome c-type biogenesis protein CcmH [Gemmatimonadales bacterium]|nr:cytochrome c-type biogenesis protein CcmH [Gemmatimonadales bacterium]
MSDQVSRRGFFAVAAAAVGAVIQDTVASGRVYDPARAGRALPPITAADNDAGIQAIEKRLKCSCGCGLDIYTCRTTDFSCTYSPGLHKQVLTLAGQGKSAQEIIDAFVAQYGQQVLMAPPKRGFNLAGYFVPSLAIVVAGAFLVRALRRWTRAAELAAPEASAPSDASPAELERLRRELDRLPG